MALTEQEAARLQELALDVCLVFESVGIRCVITLDGHGSAFLACTGETAPHAPLMLERSMLAARKRNARTAN